MLRTAAVFGFLAIALGAFGAHGLKETLAANGTGPIWETAVLYHLAHAVVMLVLALHIIRHVWAFRCFAAGVTVFSGTLYLLAVTNIKWLGAITPLGGLLLMAGWVLLFASTFRKGTGSQW
jgi:uncharacterized membrane protein YgdD (TMEM256/DUF423 family)